MEVLSIDSNKAMAKPTIFIYPLNLYLPSNYECWAERTAGHALAMSVEASFFLEFLGSFLSRKKNLATAA
jgi:hypothetical protein